MLTIAVTRGFTFVSSTPYTIADLNAAALPNITITGSVGTSDLEDGSVTYAKVLAGPYFYAATAGSSNAYTATLAPAPTALATGMSIRLAFSTVNTGAATLNLNSLGAKAIRKRAQEALEAGDLAANTIHELVYDGTYWLLQTEPGSPRRFFPTSTGSTNAYEVTLTGYTFNAMADLTGFVFAFSAHASNTGVATLNVNGKGAVAIRRHDGTVLSAGDIALNAPVLVMFDGSVFRALSIVNIATPAVATIQAVAAESNGTATALATGTSVAACNLALPSGKTWKHVRVTFTTLLDGPGAACGIESFVLKNGATTISAPFAGRGTYASNNSDYCQVVVSWEWVPSGGAESANLAMEVLASLPGAYSSGDEPANRKITVVGIAQ